MLTLVSLQVSNFGPFYGQQTLMFPQDTGVSIVFGENGRGKTTLLNAFRFALFGSIKTRAAQQITLLDVINIEARQSGQFTASVVLSFTQDSDSYELTRTIAPRPGVGAPESALDLIQEFWLSKNGNVLSPEVAKADLANIMPEQVSRFFLFDGELLQEYEELLRHESSMGADIKESIERILGLPVLTNSRQDLQEIHNNAQRQEVKAETKDLKIQQYQANLEEAIARREEHEKILRLKRAERKQCDEDRSSVAVEMQKTERLRKLLEERRQAQLDIASLKAKVIERRTKLQENLVDSWKSVLTARAKAKKQELQSEYDELVSQKAAKDAAHALLASLEESLALGSCSTCGRTLDEDSRGHSAIKLEHLRAEAEKQLPLERLEALKVALRTLDMVASADKSTLIQELMENLEDDLIAIENKDSRLTELNDLTKDVEEGEILRLTQEDRRLTQEIVILDRAIESEQAQLTETMRRIQQIEESLDKTGGADLSKERRQRELSSKLHKLFAASVDLYRDRLREKVESAATAVFLGITNDPDYTALKINENYGLSIVHRSGELVRVRSAGNEHVVALSLMGALQKNAPLKGPIIMDSPFGRLDQVHKTNLVKSLPSMADQVILLVYESEMDPQQARNILAGKLRREYRMRRVSSFNTKIEIPGAN